MEKFTKGEWKARVCDTVIPTAIVHLSNKGGFDLSGAPDATANAHLIAAAPEMYRMLDSIRQCIQWGYPANDLIEQIEPYAEDIKDLLAKARGENES